MADEDLQLEQLATRMTNLARSEARGQSLDLREEILDVAQELLLQAVSGDARLLDASPGYLRQALRYGLRTELRRRGRHREIAELPNSIPWLQREWSDSPEIMLAIAEIEVQTLQMLAGRAIRDAREINPEYVDAWLARQRQRLERESPKQSVRSFEKLVGMDLGPYSGTKELSEALGRSPGTIANRAFRGWDLIRDRFVYLLRQRFDAHLSRGESGFL